MGKLTRAMTSDGSAVALAVDSTDIVNSAIGFHNPAPTATAALGRVLTAASLMGSLLKDKDNSLTLTFRGDGSAGLILAVSDYIGNVKGYLENPSANLPPKPNGKLDVSGIVGGGVMSVVRDIGLKEPMTGISEIRSGEIAEDIAAYYAESEQIPTLLALGVLVGVDLSCAGAGGVLIQLLPGADESVVDILEHNAARLSDISRAVSSGATGKDLLDTALCGIEYDIFDETEVSYRCGCSRERMLAGLRSISKDELCKIFSEQDEIETVCRFCGKKYYFTKEITG